MAEIREISEEYTELAHELIETMPELAHLKDAPISIIYLKSDHKKRRNRQIVHGLTEKVSSKNKWAIPADITITLYDTNNIDFTDEQIKILMFHELLHVGYDFDNDRLFLNPHDLEDFRLIIDKYGAYWDKSLIEMNEINKAKLEKQLIEHDTKQSEDSQNE